MNAGYRNHRFIRIPKCPEKKHVIRNMFVFGIFHSNKSLLSKEAKREHQGFLLKNSHIFFTEI